MKTFEIYGTEIEVPDEFDIHESQYGVWIEHSHGFGVKIMNGFSDPLIVLPVEKKDGEVDRLLSYPYNPMDSDQIQRDIQEALKTIRGRVRDEKEKELDEFWI